MIWFAGISRIPNNTCCNNLNKKNKTNKKAELWMWWLLTQIRILNDIKCRICVFQSKQANNYFFHFSYVGNRIFFPRFFELFQEGMEIHLFGRTLTRSQMDFVFYTFSTFGMRSWRNAWHQLYQSRKSSAEWRAETDLFIDVIVIELYVIKI